MSCPQVAESKFAALEVVVSVDVREGVRDGSCGLKQLCPSVRDWDFKCPFLLISMIHGVLDILCLGALNTPLHMRLPLLDSAGGLRVVLGLPLLGSDPGVADVACSTLAAEEERRRSDAVLGGITVVAGLVAPVGPRVMGSEFGTDRGQVDLVARCSGEVGPHEVAFSDPGLRWKPSHPVRFVLICGRIRLH